MSGDVGRAVQDAFVSALNSGLRLGALIALVGAALAWALIDVRAGGAEAQRVQDEQAAGPRARRWPRPRSTGAPAVPGRSPGPGRVRRRG